VFKLGPTTQVTLIIISVTILPLYMKLCLFVQSVFHVFNVPKSIFKYVEGRIPKCVNGKVIHDYVELMVND
jgi:hypothetical protein